MICFRMYLNSTNIFGNLLNMLGPIFCFRPGLIFRFQSDLIFFSFWCGDSPSRADDTSHKIMLRMLLKPHMIKASLYPSLLSAQAGIGGTIGTEISATGALRLARKWLTPFLPNTGRIGGSPRTGYLGSPPMPPTPTC